MNKIKKQGYVLEVKKIETIFVKKNIYINNSIHIKYCIVRN